MTNFGLKPANHVFAVKRGLKMNLQNEKCVMIIDENLPLGIIANTAAIMGITLGREMPEIVGSNVTDQSGKEGATRSHS